MTIASLLAGKRVINQPPEWLFDGAPVMHVCMSSLPQTATAALSAIDLLARMLETHGRRATRAQECFSRIQRMVRKTIGRYTSSTNLSFRRPRACGGGHSRRSFSLAALPLGSKAWPRKELRLQCRRLGRHGCFGAVSLPLSRELASRAGALPTAWRFGCLMAEEGRR
jgi:hypothetical protein